MYFLGTPHDQNEFYFYCHRYNINTININYFGRREFYCRAYESNRK